MEEAIKKDWEKGRLARRMEEEDDNTNKEERRRMGGGKIQGVTLMPTLYKVYNGVIGKIKGGGRKKGNNTNIADRI